MENLLIYTVVADASDIIQFSALFDPCKKVYSMPSLRIMDEGKEVFYADNGEWLDKTLLLAVDHFLRREVEENEWKIIEMLPRWSLTDPWMREIRDILNYATENDML